MSDYVVAADIGGTSMTVAAVAASGSVLQRIEIASPAREGGDGFVKVISNSIKVRWPDARAVGVGTAGTVDPWTGCILSASNSFAHWTGYQFAERLIECVSCPVAVNNDVDAFLIGESRFGVAKGCDDCLAVMLGTGVGGALLIDGTVLSGKRGAAGEIGHMPGFGALPCTCGGFGHLETVAGGRGIARRYCELAGYSDDGSGARVVSEAAARGDVNAKRALDEAGEALGLSLTMAATLLDIDMVVLAGGVLGGWQWLEPGVRRSLGRYPLVSGADLTLERSQLGSEAVLLGAAESAWRVLGCRI